MEMALRTEDLTGNKEKQEVSKQIHDCRCNNPSVKNRQETKLNKAHKEQTTSK